MMHSRRMHIALIVLLVSCAKARAELIVPSILSDNMVLQREKEIRIWGKGTDGADVTVRFKDQARTTVVKAGHWLLTLDAEPAGGPFEMTISSGEEKKLLKNILIGEIWQASGQSNMQWAVMAETHKEEALKFPPNDQIRLFKQDRQVTAEPLFDTRKARWSADSTASRRHFSAVAYYFARDLHKALGVPVGITLACDGGTKTQFWTPLKAFQGKPEFKATLDEAILAKDNFAQLESKFEAAKAEYFRKRNAGEKAGAHPTFFGRVPCAYYNGMIHPIRNYTIRGVIWYQGERNSMTTQDGVEYRDYFPLMINAWRDAFGQPELPFFFVQLPKLHPRDIRIAAPTRESQMWTANNIRNTGMVVTLDIGEAGLHPKLKRPIGQRLAKLAQAKVYGQHVEYASPLYKSAKIEGTKMVIQFGRSPASLQIFGADGIRDWDANDDESLANVLKKIDPDYVCAHLGKWHIGRSPEALGYDVSDGSTGNGTGNSQDADDPKLIFDLSRRSNQFIRKQIEAGKPFFLQISHYANHLKYQAKADTIRKYETEHADKATPYQNSPLWAAMNENLDAGIGMVLDQIEKLGIADNTYVFYTADNGYELKRDFGKPVHERGYYKAYPQRSHKYHVSEGGIRVPFIVRGPGIPTGTHSPVPVVGTDIFATVMDLAGGAGHIPARVEGASLTAHLKSGGKEEIDRKDDFLVFKHSKPRPPHDITIVQGRYKLIKDISTDKVFLFDLKEDIGERNDLADEQPDRTAEMYAAMTAYFKRFGWDESKIETVPLPGRNPTPKKPFNPRIGQRSNDDWFKPFNEEDLTGWDGAKGLWRVSDGTIIGETTIESPLEHHSYLIWRDGEVEDFELRLKFRISGRQGNSGVQYRSRDLGDHNVAGYQYNIQGTRPGATAVLEEMKNGRGGHLASIGQRVHLLSGDVRKILGTTGDKDEINASFKGRWWNALVIRAEENRLQHWLNGHLAVDVVDDDRTKSAARGLLAFQLHSGPPMKIELKEIRLRHLKPASKPSTSPLKE